MLVSGNGCFVDVWLEELWLYESRPEAVCPDKVCPADDVIDLGVVVEDEAVGTPK